MSVHWFSRSFLPILLIPVLLLAAIPNAGRAQTLADDAFAQKLLGNWTGEGSYDGNILELRREWTLELGDHFLRADMRVLMPNGVTFRSLSYWKKAAENEFEITRMDETGRSRSMSATRNPENGDVALEFVDDFAEGGPARRRSIYRFVDDDHYVEQLLGESSEGWQRIAEFSFRRNPSETER